MWGTALAYFHFLYRKFQIHTMVLITQASGLIHALSYLPPPARLFRNTPTRSALTAFVQVLAVLHSWNKINLMRTYYLSA